MFGDVLVFVQSSLFARTLNEAKYLFTFAYLLRCLIEIGNGCDGFGEILAKQLPLPVLTLRQFNIATLTASQKRCGGNDFSRKFVII